MVRIGQATTKGMLLLATVGWLMLFVSDVPGKSQPVEPAPRRSFFGMVERSAMYSQRMVFHHQKKDVVASCSYSSDGPPT